MSADAKCWSDEPCRRCDQTGTVYRQVGQLGRHSIAWVATTCDDCGGTGRVLKAEVSS